MILKSRIPRLKATESNKKINARVREPYGRHSAWV